MRCTLWTQLVAVVASVGVLLSSPTALHGQAAGLTIVVIDGEDAVNIIQQKTAVAPVVEVRDRNDQPVAGAIVRFAVRGGRATFNGARTLSVTTNAAGRAVATGLTPTGSGALQIGATASFQGQTAAVTIAQTNVLTAAQGAGGSGAGGGAGAGAAGGGSATGAGVTTATVAGVGGGLSTLAVAGVLGGAGVGAVVAAKALTSDTAGVPGGNTPPQVSGVTATPSVVLLGTDTPIALNAQATAPGGNTLTYSWDFGDGSTGSGASATHIYRTSGQFTAKVTVSGGGASTNGQTEISVKTLTGSWNTNDSRVTWALTQNGSSVRGTQHWFATTSSGALLYDQDCPINGTVASASPRITLIQSGCQFPPYFDLGDTIRVDPSSDINTLTGTWTDHNPTGSVTSTIMRRQ